MLVAGQCLSYGWRAIDTGGRYHRRQRNARRGAAGFNVAEPFLEQWLQLAHVLEAQVQSFKARDGRLREIVAVQLSHCHADVTLRKTCN